MKVSVGAAGFLVTVFAVVYALSAPILGVALARFRPRWILIGAMAGFAVANVLAMVAPTFETLAVARALAGLAAAAYSPAAVAAAVKLVPAEMRGRAASTVFGGLAVSLVTGVPLGAYVSYVGGWRATFALVSALALAATAGLHVSLPPLPTSPAITLADRVAPLRRRAVVVTLTAGFVWMTGGFAFYTYISAQVEASTGWSSGSLGPILLLYGIGAIVGNYLGGRGTDGRLGEGRTLVTALSSLVVAYAVLALATHVGPTMGTVLALCAIAVVAVAGWTCTPPQAHRVISLAPERSTELLALNTTANYLGIGAGAALGSVLLDNVSVEAIPIAAATCQVIGIVGVRYVDRLRRAGPRTTDSTNLVDPSATVSASG